MGIMRMDMLKFKEVSILATISLTWILVCFIIGLAGPQMWEKETYYAYDCPDESHEWSNDCQGVQMSQGQFWIQNFGKIIYLNRIWVLTMKPYSLPYEEGEDVDVDEKLYIEVRIDGKDNSDDQWQVSDGPTESKQDLNCPKGEQKCDSFTLINSEILDWRYYKVDIVIKNTTSRQYVGDVQFTYWKGSSDYAIEEIIFRVIYLICSGVFSYLFINEIQKLGDDVEFEQRTLAMIMLSLFLFNNPLFFFEFNKVGWIFRFIGTLFEVLFTSILMIYWLFLIDKIRLDLPRIEYSREHLPKLILVAIYGILSLALYGWIRVELVDDPVFEDSDVPTGELVLFYLVAVAYCAIVIWLVVLVILAAPVVWSKGYLFNRLNFTGIPTCACIFSVIVGLFSGTIGPVGRTSVGFMYFFALYNVYCYLLCYGYWPHKDTYATLPEPTPTFGEDPETHGIRTQNNTTWYDREVEITVGDENDL